MPTESMSFIYFFFAYCIFQYFLHLSIQETNLQKKNLAALLAMNLCTRWTGNKLVFVREWPCLFYIEETNEEMYELFLHHVSLPESRFGGVEIQSGVVANWSTD